MSELFEDRIMSFCIEEYPHRTPEEKFLTWQDFVAFLRLNRKDTDVKHDACFWAPVRWLDVTKGLTTKNVKWVDFLVFDIDHGLTDEAFEDLRRNLHKYAAIMHTTFGHDASMLRGKGARVRIIIALTRSIQPDEWVSFRQHMTGLLDVTTDPMCDNINRAYYMPTKSGEFHVFNGLALNPTDYGL